MSREDIYSYKDVICVGGVLWYVVSIDEWSVHKVKTWEEKQFKK